MYNKEPDVYEWEERDLAVISNYQEQIERFYTQDVSAQQANRLMTVDAVFFAAQYNSAILPEFCSREIGKKFTGFTLEANGTWEVLAKEFSEPKETVPEVKNLKIDNVDSAPR